MAKTTRADTVAAQGCVADGRAPAGNPYACDRCDLAETGNCGKATAELTTTEGLTAGDLATAYGGLADGAQTDDPTMYTDDDLYYQATRLKQALGVVLAAADEIRGARPAAPEPKVYRLD